MTRGLGAASLGLAVLAGGASVTRAHDPITTKITFAREIRAILAARCVMCHAPGGSAPMPLTTYEEVRPWARAIKDQILTRGMPKWHAARGFGAFSNDPTLTPFEQSLLVSWLDGGLPEGSPARTVAARAVGGLPVTQTSGTIRVSVPARGDIARMAAGGPQWVTGWTFAPGDPLITAAVISLDGVPAAAWVAGDRPATLPAGTGFRTAGRIRIDVRRRAATDYEQPFAARRSVLTLLTETGPLRRAWTEQVSCGALRSGVSAELLAVRPLLDRPEARLWVARAGAPPAIVGWFRAFDPLYPRTYWLRRPADFSVDARLLSDGPCRVELTLAAPVTALR